MHHKIIVVTSKNKIIKEMGHRIVNTLGKFKVDAVLWNEKEYLTNEPTISSSQWVIFIGETETGELLKDSIKKWNYDHLNMKYGWIGNKIILFVEDKLFSSSEYENLNRITLKQEQDIKNGIFSKKLGSTCEYFTHLVNKNKTPFVLSFPFVPFSSIPLFLIYRSKNEKVKKEQYNYLTNHFLSEGFKKFMDEKNE